MLLEEVMQGSVKARVGLVHSSLIGIHGSLGFLRCGTVAKQVGIVNLIFVIISHHRKLAHASSLRTWI